MPKQPSKCSPRALSPLTKGSALLVFVICLKIFSELGKMGKYDLLATITDADSAKSALEQLATIL